MKKSDGFTIVELLIVIVVIGILAGLVLNTFKGVQAKAKATVIVNNFKQIEKGLTLRAIDDGITEWWAEDDFAGCAAWDEHSPRLVDMIENCGFEDYLQSVSSLSDIRNFTYDSDGNSFTGCGSTVHAGVNIAVHDDLPYEIFERVDDVIDGDTALDKDRCGRVRWSNNQRRIFFLIDSVASDFSS